VDLQDAEALLEERPKEHSKAVAMPGALTLLPGWLSAGVRITGQNLVDDRVQDAKTGHGFCQHRSARYLLVRLS
jgi:hypothetical protein